MLTVRWWRVWEMISPVEQSDLASSPVREQSHITSYQIILCHIILCHIVSYYIIPYHIISYHIISYYIIFYHIILRNNILYHIMSHLKSYSRLFSVTSIITCLTQGPFHVDTVHPWPSIKGIEVLRRNGLVVNSISGEKAHKACWRQQSICEFLLPISTWKDARLVKPNSDARLCEFIVY